MPMIGIHELCAIRMPDPNDSRKTLRVLLGVFQRVGPSNEAEKQKCTTGEIPINSTAIFEMYGAIEDPKDLAAIDREMDMADRHGIMRSYTDVVLDERFLKHFFRNLDFTVPV